MIQRPTSCLLDLIGALKIHTNVSVVSPLLKLTHTANWHSASFACVAAFIIMVHSLQGMGPCHVAFALFCPPFGVSAPIDLKSCDCGFCCYALWNALWKTVGSSSRQDGLHVDRKLVSQWQQVLCISSHRWWNISLVSANHTLNCLVFTNESDTLCGHRNHLYFSVLYVWHGRIWICWYHDSSL